MWAVIGFALSALLVFIGTSPDPAPSPCHIVHGEKLVGANTFGRLTWNGNDMLLLGNATGIYAALNNVIVLEWKNHATKPDTCLHPVRLYPDYAPGVVGIFVSDSMPFIATVDKNGALDWGRK